MAFEVGSIVARITLDTSQFTQAVNIVTRKAKQLGERTSAQLKNALTPISTVFSDASKQADRFAQSTNSVIRSTGAAATAVQSNIKKGIDSTSKATESIAVATSASIGAALGRLRTFEQVAASQSKKAATTFSTNFGKPVVGTVANAIRAAQKSLASLKIDPGQVISPELNKQLSTALLTPVQKFNREILQLPSKVGAGFRSVGRTIADALQGISPTTFNALTSALTRVGTVARSVFNTIGQSRVFQILKAEAGDFAGAAGAFFTRVLLPPARFAFRTIQALGRRAFRSLQRAGLNALRRIGRGFRLLLNPLAILQKSIFNIRNIIGVVLAGFVVRRAVQVDQLSAAFANLTSQIGGTADVFLGKLRAATRGTVSDLELMRTANNAVLLGVAKSTDEFARLANVARRLGRAVGRDPVNALNDLAVGIGRQSRLILDNLGIIVPVEKAYEAYARSLDVSVNSLTDAQKRQAFLNATLDSAEKKVKSLGEDVDTLSDQWGRFTAALQNAIDALAQGLVGGELADAFAQFVTDQLQTIRAAGRAVRRFLSGAFNIGGLILEQIRGIESGARFQAIVSALSRLFKSVFAIAFRVLFTLILVNFKDFLPLFFRVLGIAFTAIIDVIAEASAKAFLALFANLRKNANALGQVLLTTIGIPLLKDIPKLENAVDAFFAKVDTSITKIEDGELVTRVGQGGLFGRFFGDIGEQADAAAEEVIEAAKTLGSEFRKAITQEFDSLEIELKGTVLEPLLRFAPLIRRVFGLFDFEANDPFAFLDPQVVNPKVRIVQSLFEKLVSFRNLLVSGDFVKGPFLVAQTDQLDRFLKLIRELIPDLNKAAAALDKFLKPAALDPEQLQGLQEVARSFETEIRPRLGEDTATPIRPELQDLRANTRRVEDLITSAIDSRRVILDQAVAFIKGAGAPEVFVRLANDIKEAVLRANESAIRNSDEVKKLLSDLNKQAAGARRLEVSDQLVGIEDSIRNIGLTDAQAEVANIGRELEGWRVALGEGSEEFKKLEATLDTFSAKITKLEELKAITSLAGDITRAIGNGIAEGFLRGESLAKQWSNIVADIFRAAMSRVIDSIANKVQQVLSKVFEQVGLGAGAGAFAASLIAIGAIIVQSLQGERETTIDDFSDAISSSEAVRGVVAGPTNVAISQIGEQLKFAFGTTERLLERIAIAIETGGGIGGTPVGEGSSFRLSGSTTS